MKSGLGICGAIALVIAMLSANAAGATSIPAPHYQSGPIDRVTPATDLSARRRMHRHARHSRAIRRPPAYYARPYYYRPDGMAPFFPFHHGYGLDPSW
jgi:hypothetical protein